MLVKHMGQAKKYKDIVQLDPFPVKCPNCGQVVAHDDRRQTMNIVAMCRKCRLRVTYFVDNCTVKSEPLPHRNCSSGMTYR